MTVKEIHTVDKHYQVEGTGYSPMGKILAGQKEISLTSSPVLAACLRNGLLCNDSYLESEAGQPTVAGDPTEGALIVAANKAGLQQAELEAAMPRLDAIPFDSQFQYMATLHGDKNSNSQNIIYVKGAVRKNSGELIVSLIMAENLLSIVNKSIEWLKRWAIEDYA